MRAKNNFSQRYAKATFASQSGFTLVELLIVIVIIGILAGVVIGVLNPVQQQNRARDGATRAQLDKMALSGKSLYVSSPRNSGRSPTPEEFAAGIGSITSPQTDCTVVIANPGTTNGTCRFAISGQNLPADCTSNYTGSGGGTQCLYMYWRSPNSFRVSARGAANPVMNFVYEYTENASGTVTEGFYTCPANFDAMSTSPVGASGCTLMN